MTVNVEVTNEAPGEATTHNGYRLRRPRSAKMGSGRFVAFSERSEHDRKKRGGLGGRPSVFSLFRVQIGAVAESANPPIVEVPAPFEFQYMARSAMMGRAPSRDSTRIEALPVTPLSAML